jgi:hypothetical protein
VEERQDIWRKLTLTLVSHQRTTIVVTDEAGTVHHIRQTGMPESDHAEIYRKLGVAHRANRKREIVAKRL